MLKIELNCFKQTLCATSIYYSVDIYTFMIYQFNNIRYLSYRQRKQISLLELFQFKIN